MAFFEDFDNAMQNGSPLAKMLKVPGQRMQPDIPEEDARAMAAQRQPTGGVSAPTTTQRTPVESSGGLEPIKGAAARIQAGSAQPQRGVSVTNTYDIDRPASMGNPANDPWKDMARQLENFSKLRAMDSQQGGYAGTYMPYQRPQHEIDNEEKTRRWALEDAVRGLSDKDKAQVWLAYQKDETDRRGQDMTAGVAVDRNAIASRGQDLDFNSRMGVASMQGRNQMDIEHMRGQRQLDAYGLHGQNQLANTALGYSLAGQNQMGLERYKQMMQDQDPYRLQQMEESKARAGLYGVQRESAERNLAFDKSADASIQKWAKLYIDSGMEPQQAIAEALRAHLGSTRAAKQGYADGGQVQMTEGERLMAEMAKKYGAPSGVATPAPQPAPQPAPAMQQPQRQESWAEKARRLATGGLDQRMKGYATGGPIAVGGRQVLGEGTGKSDSLPAVIDDEQPAALSTGEFVLPVETVRFFGLDKLNKMVAQSRKGLDTGREDA